MLLVEDDDGVRYDAYVFRATEGQRFGVGLDSDDFDPMVHVGRMISGS